MEQTANYGLNQWDAGDRIMVEDFNADNAKVDAALGDHEERVDALETTCASLGNCLFYTASYTGNGGTASHTFPHKPMVVMIKTPYTPYQLIFWQGQTSVYPIGANYYEVNLTWNGNTVSWSSNNLDYGANQKGTTYHILALLDAAQ